MRKFLGVAIVACFLLVASCAPMDNIAGIDAQGNDLPGPSQAETTIELVEDLVPAPWGKIGGGLLASALGVYIWYRRKKAKASK